MSRTVADELVETLAQAGVQRIYGLVGDSLNPVTDALHRSGKVQWVHVRHEETAAFAAGAEAQLTGKLAVCAGSCGPGNLHLINGLFDAHRSMAPVLAIASHIATSEIGIGYFQETHPDQLFRECSHYCELVSNPHQMPRVLQSAMQHAVSKRGVSVIVLPGDVAALDTKRDTQSATHYWKRANTRESTQAVPSDDFKRSRSFNGKSHFVWHQPRRLLEGAESPAGEYELRCDQDQAGSGVLTRTATWQPPELLFQCPTCKGTGQYTGLSDVETCRVCGGRKVVSS